MMKTVLLLRHAKSDWSKPGLADFDRPLAKRGLNDAPRMGHVLVDFNVVPDKILASSARRARQTTKLVAEACGYKGSITWQDSFYGGSSDTLVSALQQLPENVERAMLVGHNPTMEETASTLLLGYGARWSQGFDIRMPTAALVCLDLDTMTWADLEPGDATLRWFLIPRLVKAIQ
jgi:phosphohistidine phosphatase